MGLTLMFVGCLIAAWGAVRLFAELQPEPAPANPEYPGPM